MARRSLVAVAAAAVWALAGCSAGPAKAPVADAPPVLVHAAGSLREAFTEIARDHEARTGQKVALVCGASGLLRECFDIGEPAQVCGLFFFVFF